MKLQIQTGVLVVTALCLSGAALGAGAPTVPDSLRACAKKQDVLQRLSCYDAETAKLDNPQAAAPAAAAPAAAKPAAAAPAAAAAAAAAAPVARSTASPPATLGSEQLRNNPATALGEEQVRKPAPSSSWWKFWKSDDKPVDTGMTARIEGLKRTPYGLAVMTLDNGQVWRQLEVEDNFPLDEGDTVRIEKAALGSYRLTPVREGWKRFTRVTRSK
jgi:hypothetical protein